MLQTTPATRGLRAVQADLRALPVASGTVAVVVAFYSLHHLVRRELPRALGEVVRILRPGGRFLLATHLGAGEVVSSEFLGHQVKAFGGTLYSAEDITSELERSGLELTEVRTREPLAHEYPSRRIYLLARR
jgi:SAM-dependent methyltransferase